MPSRALASTPRLPLATALVGAALVACSPGVETFDDGSGGSGASGPSTTSTSGATSSTGSSTGTFMSGSGGGMGTRTTCSGDLKQVLAEDGTDLQTCGPDEGCANGGCVPACEAAAASAGSLGCDYLLATPNFINVILPPCFAAFVANSWDKPVKIQVSRGGQSYDVTQFGRIAQESPSVPSWQPVPATGLPPGQVAVLFLSHDPASVNGTPLTCPIQPAVSLGNGTQVVGTGTGQAWSITTDAPVTVYDILPYGGADSFLPSAELVLPTTAWGTNYVAALPPGQSDGFTQMWGQIVARETTAVQILPNVALPGGNGVNPLPAGVQGSFTLQAGQFVQWDGPAMTGTIIQTDKPVAFVGGNTYQCYASQTSSGGGCDSGHQQIAPVSATGSDYLGMPYTTRSTNGSPESIVYRVVGMKDGTQLSFDPPIPSAPAGLALGQSFDFEATGAFRVKSQSTDFPFYIGEAMSGCQLLQGQTADCLGDEDFVNILPPAQWLSRYVFFTDPTYPTTNLVFARRKNGSGLFADVNLDCLGTIGGWQPVGTSGEFEITNVDLVREMSPNGACNNGPHTAESASSFGLVVWGLDTFSSYAYPAGGNASTINTVVVPPVPQ